MRSAASSQPTPLRSLSPMLAEERVFKYAIANEGSGGDLSTKLVTSRLPQQHGAFLRELPAEIIRHACVGLVQNRPGPRRERVRGQPGAESEMHDRLVTQSG